MCAMKFGIDILQLKILYFAKKGETYSVAIASMFKTQTGYDNSLPEQPIKSLRQKATEELQS